MDPSQLDLPPPRDWQDFERLCHALWEREWNCPTIQLHGRCGQKQCGVDIFGRPNDGLRFHGIQCKLKGRDSGAPPALTLAELDHEVSQAAAFNPPLEHLIVATTAPADAAIQEVARELSERHAAAGLFRVDVLAWPEIRARLTKHDDLVKRFYPFAPEQARDGEKSRLATRLSANLPKKLYGRLIGRELVLDHLVDRLCRADDSTIQCLFGLGGIGKTSLALEAACVCSSQNAFWHIVWFSAASERFDGEGRVYSTSRDALTMDKLILEIGRQCGYPLMVDGDASLTRKTVSQLLHDEKTLIVLDNMETAPQPQTIVAELFDLIAQSRLLVTSRSAIPHHLAVLRKIEGLETPEDSVKFLRSDASTRHIRAIELLCDEDLRRIHDKTGGAPLAMQLVAGQVEKFGLSQSLDYLTIKESGPDEEFYRFIYRRSWNALSEDARTVLNALTSFPLASGAAQRRLRSLISARSSMWDGAFGLAIAELASYALVTRSELNGRNYYRLHPLTYWFMRKDIRKELETRG